MSILDYTRVGVKHCEGRDRFQAFAVPCTPDIDIQDIIAALVSEYRLKKATHLTWAVRYAEGSTITEKKNDGGESGAGNSILDIMRKKDTRNTLVLVARWFGGKHLGGLRFRIYRKLTDNIT